MTGAVVWFTGRPASGKTTLARSVRERLVARGDPCCLLDGDEVRAALVPPPGYSAEERENFYSTLSGLGAMLAEQGLTVLIAATAHRRAFRVAARARAPRYLEVYVAATRKECEARDVKQLYADVAAGRMTGLPGADVAFETPDEPDVIAVGGFDCDAVDRVIEALDSAKGGEPWRSQRRSGVSEWS